MGRVLCRPLPGGSDRQTPHLRVTPHPSTPPFLYSYCDRQTTTEDRKDQRMDQRTQRGKASTMDTSFGQDYHFAVSPQATHSGATK